MTLLYLGLLVILGFAASRLCKRIGLPSVTGYMLVGLALGPSVFKVVGPETLTALKPLSALGLAVIFFLLGEEFKLDELRRLGFRFLMMTVVQSLVTFAIVTGLLLLFKAPLPIALLLGAIAGTTDPAATVSVIREMKGKGELAKTLMAIVALNGFVEMCLFSALLPLVELTHHGAGAVSWLSAVAGAHARIWRLGGVGPGAWRRAQALGQHRAGQAEPQVADDWPDPSWAPAPPRPCTSRFCS